MAKLISMTKLTYRLWQPSIRCLVDMQHPPAPQLKKFLQLFFHPLFDVCSNGGVSFPCGGEKKNAVQILLYIKLDT